MWTVQIILITLWIRESQQQTCPPLPTIPPEPVEKPIDVLQKLLGAWGILRGEWGNWTISFRPPKKFPFKDFDEPAKGDCERKEYRQLSKKDLNKFHKAMNEFHKTSDFNLFVNEHDQIRSPNAHFGCAFPCWHRHYLHVMELNLRKLNKRYKKLCLPYWDSALDHGLPSPEDSALWTKFYWGKGNGDVTNGKLCPNWKVTEACESIGSIVTRRVTGDRDLIYSRGCINNLMAFGNFCSIERTFEREHGAVHCFVGACTSDRGHMASLQCSPNDPVFFLHHAFVDCLWYEWCERVSTDCSYCDHCGEGHGPNDHMLPFPGLENSDGCRENYYKKCAKRPSLLTCATDEDCKSPSNMLFCYQCQCMGKVAQKGNCTGLPDNACYCHKKNEVPKCTKKNRCKCNKA